MCFSSPKPSQQATTPPPIVAAPIETATTLKEAGQTDQKTRRKRLGRESLRIVRPASVNVGSQPSGVNI